MITYLENDYKKAKELLEALDNLDTLDQNFINQLDDITYFLIQMRKHAAHNLKMRDLPQ